MEIHICRGDVTDVSAETEVLHRMLLTHSYTMGYRLNSGVSAEVFTVTETATQAVFAAKVYFKCDRNSIIEACTEQVCMTRANSPHVLACCGFYMHRGRPCLVLELARMSLRDFLEVRSSASLIAEISVRSPRNSLTLITCVNIFWIKASKKHLIQF